MDKNKCITNAQHQVETINAQVLIFLEAQSDGFLEQTKGEQCDLFSLLFTSVPI